MKNKNITTKKKFRVVASATIAFLVLLSVHALLTFSHSYEPWNPSAAGARRTKQQPAEVQEEDTLLPSSTISFRSSLHAYANATGPSPPPPPPPAAAAAAPFSSSSSPPDEEAISGHCIFIVTKLFGHHDDSRINATLNWFLGATAGSVRTAAATATATATAATTAGNGNATLAVSSADNEIKHVGMYLFARHSYAKEGVQARIRRSYRRMYEEDNKDEENDYERRLRPIQRVVELVLGNHRQRMREAAAETRCRSVSVTRIDADDALLPGAFRKIRKGWDEAITTAKKECSLSSASSQSSNTTAPINNTDDGSPCGNNNENVVMVTGMESLPTLSIHPPSNNKNNNNPNDLLIPHQEQSEPQQQQQQHQALQRQAIVVSGVSDKYYQCSLEQTRKNFFLSVGLTATMPVHIWLNHYGGDERVINQQHTLVLRNVKADMDLINVTTVSNNVTGLGIYVKTPLSGHYQFPQQQQQQQQGDDTSGDGSSKCDLEWLSRHLGSEGAGQMVWGAMPYLPRQLSKEQWCQNHFVSVNTPKQLEKVRDEICHDNAHNRSRTNDEK